MTPPADRMGECAPGKEALDALDRLTETRRNIAASLIAVKGHLDTPYTDDPRWTPWTRFIERELQRLDESRADVATVRSELERLREERDALREASDAKTVEWHRLYTDYRKSEEDYLAAEAEVRQVREELDEMERDRDSWVDQCEDARRYEAKAHEEVRRLTEGLRDAAVVIEKMANGASREEVEPEFSRFHALCCDEHTEFAWLVERGQSEGHDRPIWAEPELSDGRFGWTFDANLARRFPTKEAAEDYIASRDNLTARAVEHGFVARALLPASPSDGGGA